MPAGRSNVTPRRRTLVAGGLLLGLSVAVAPPLGAQDAEGDASEVVEDEPFGTGRVVVDDGHIDIGPRFVDGDWTLMVRDDTVDPSEWRDLHDVVLRAGDAARVELPDDPDFAFLGDPGNEVWLLPQVQNPEILWPGWNTQEPEVATTINREVTWALHSVDGPGELILFVNEAFGRPLVLFDSTAPYPQTVGIEVYTHAHGNWTFTEPGVYLLGIEMRAVTIDGEEVADTGIVQVAVGDATDPEDAFAAGAAAGPVEIAAEIELPDLPEDGGAEAVAGEDGDAGTTGAADEPEGSDDGSVLPWLAAAAGALLAVGGIALVVARRRSRDTPGDDPRADDEPTPGPDDPAVDEPTPGADEPSPEPDDPAADESATGDDADARSDEAGDGR